MPPQSLTKPYEQSRWTIFVNAMQVNGFLRVALIDAEGNNHSRIIHLEIVTQLDKDGTVQTVFEMESIANYLIRENGC